MSPMIPRSCGGAPWQARCWHASSIACDNRLYFYGLNTSKDINVIFAVNRSQTQGSAGNFTMFRSVQGTGRDPAPNVTVRQTDCNVDLKFPLLDPITLISPAALTRGDAAHADAIARFRAGHLQRQATAWPSISDGFVSRLNLLPFPMTYINSHIERQRPRSVLSAAFTSKLRAESSIGTNPLIGQVLQLRLSTRSPPRPAIAWTDNPPVRLYGMAPVTAASA